MEDLRSHTKRCDVTRERLDEWYNHRIRVEAELSKLAWHFEKWGQESESHIAAGSVAGKSKNTGPKQNTMKWMDDVVGLLEIDRFLSEKLFNSIAELQTNEAVLSFKDRCGIFDGEGHSSPTECCTSNSAREACHSRKNAEFLLRQKVKTPLLCKAICTLAISVPWHLAEVVKRIKDVEVRNKQVPHSLNWISNFVKFVEIEGPRQKLSATVLMTNLAVADRRSRCETAKLLHVFAASAKVQSEELRSSIMEYLED